jgi:CubicO group peptidase (beta-lactamase class C family)
VHRLVGQGRLDYEDPVARNWPEFAASGKEGITVRQVLSHQAGLPAVRARLPDRAMFDWSTMIAALSAEEPWWVPGTAHGYHVNTFGFLVGEIVRRVSGQTLGTVFREEVAAPLGADVHIGLDAAEDHRVAEFIWPERLLPEPGSPGVSNDQLMERNAYANPRALSGAGVVNTREWRAAEVPSANAHATARGVARVYEALAAGGVAGGVRVVDDEALQAAIVEQVYGEDLILHRRSRFGLGFQLTQAERPLGPNPRSYGHFGAGGSLGFCDPDAGVAFGYVQNQMGPRWQNPRNRALIDALYVAMG